MQNTGENLLIENFADFVPEEFEITAGSVEEVTVAQRIKEFYYGDTEPSRENITAAVNLYTDASFGFPATRAVMEHLQTLSEPIYFYVFSADTVLNYFKQEEPRLQEFPGKLLPKYLDFLNGLTDNSLI